jgi:hypothetical protein
VVGESGLAVGQLLVAVQHPDDLPTKFSRLANIKEVMQFFTHSSWFNNHSNSCI